ncbi:hypothetical protein [Ureibacillus massiliensis]|uniref:hypothetical protein n=1 Tax=Ureibacillus massiliensis TaxID=292806 RepID=UPI0011323AC0|nr:hypothetical protein [Ureibacillus massiliensis]
MKSSVLVIEIDRTVPLIENGNGSEIVLRKDSYLICKIYTAFRDNLLRKRLSGEKFVVNGLNARLNGQNVPISRHKIVHWTKPMPQWTKAAVQRTKYSSEWTKHTRFWT